MVYLFSAAQNMNRVLADDLIQLVAQLNLLLWSSNVIIQLGLTYILLGRPHPVLLYHTVHSVILVTHKVYLFFVIKKL